MGSMTEAPEVAALSPEDRVRWETSWREHNEWILYQHTIEKEMKEARTAGLAEGILQTARNMKNDGLPAATISKYTGLTEEEINNL